MTVFLFNTDTSTQNEILLYLVNHIIKCAHTCVCVCVCVCVLEHVDAHLPRCECVVIRLIIKICAQRHTQITMTKTNAELNSMDD